MFAELDTRALEHLKLLQYPFTRVRNCLSTMLSKSLSTSNGEGRRKQVLMLILKKIYIVIIYELCIVATPIRIEGKPNGVSEYVLVAYAPLSSSSAVIRLEDIRSPYPSTTIKYN